MPTEPAEKSKKEAVRKNSTKTDCGSCRIFQWVLCHQHRAAAPEVWTGCCPATSLGALSYLRRWQLLPLVSNRFLASLDRNVFPSPSTKTNKSPVISRSLFFVEHASEHTPNALSLYVHSLLLAGKCGTRSNVSLSEKIAADSFCLFCRGFYSCDLFKTKFRLNMYQTLLAESEIYVHTENSRNATCHPVCRKKLSSLQMFFLNKKDLLFLQFCFCTTTRLVSFLLLTCIAESVDLEGEWPGEMLVPFVPLEISMRRESLRVQTPLQLPHTSLHWSSRLWWPELDSIMW